MKIKLVACNVGGCTGLREVNHNCVVCGKGPVPLQSAPRKLPSTVKAKGKAVIDLITNASREEGYA